MENFHLNSIGSQFFYSLTKSLQSTLNVRSQDNAQLFHLTFLKLLKKIIQRDFCTACQFSFTVPQLTLLADIFRHFLIRHNNKFITRSGYATKALHLNGCRWNSLFYLLTFIVG